MTKIEKQATRSRYNIYLDGDYSFSVAENTLVRFALAKEKNLEKEEISSIVEQEAVEKAMTRSLRILSYRPHSVKEIKTKLTKSTDERIIKIVLDRLIGSGYLDDEKFALEYVETRKKGNRVLAQELLQKGIPKDLAVNALSERGEGSERELLLDFYKKAQQKYGSESEPKRKMKISRYLSSKGFSYELIKAALREK